MRRLEDTWRRVSEHKASGLRLSVPRISDSCTSRGFIGRLLALRQAPLGPRRGAIWPTPCVPGRRAHGAAVHLRPRRRRRGSAGGVAGDEVLAVVARGRAGGSASSRRLARLVVATSGATVWDPAGVQPRATSFGGRSGGRRAAAGVPATESTGRSHHNRRSRLGFGRKLGRRARLLLRKQIFRSPGRLAKSASSTRFARNAPSFIGVRALSGDVRAKFRADACRRSSRSLATPRSFVLQLLENAGVRRGKMFGACGEELFPVTFHQATPTS